MAEWYYNRNDKRYGPVSQAEIEEYLHTKSLPTDKFKVPGSDQWVFGSEVEDVISGARDQRTQISHSTKLPSDDKFKEGMRPVTDWLDERKWEVARHTTLGAAGLSVAILFIVAQIGVSTPALWISLFCAAVAIPIWATLWQIGEAYSFYAVRPNTKLSLRNGFIIGILLYIVGGIFLLLSFATFIWHFSAVAAIIFLLVSASGIILTVRHQATVRNQAGPSRGNGV